MSLNTFFATKLTTTQVFDDKGNRIVSTILKTDPLVVTQVKSLKPDGYSSYQVAIGKKSAKNISKPLKSHLKSSKLKTSPLFIREIRLIKKPDSSLKAGDLISISDILKPGDIIKASGFSKGKGFSGAMKRHGFHGGPRTHGQSDRQRSPGSIGMRTTPGRVWKGKKMAGHMGYETKTIRNLEVLALDQDNETLTISGTIPGSPKTLIQLTKTGENPKPVKLFTSQKSVSKKPVSKKSSPKSNDKN